MLGIEKGLRMMRSALLSIAVLAMGSAAAAQLPRVPVPVYASERFYGCSDAFIRGLEGTDGFLALRAGPSMRERMLARLPANANVYACVRRGNWFGIVVEQHGQRTGCDVRRHWARTASYRGPCRSGWVHYDYLGGYADYISP
jgi:hypothetical protein